MNWLEVKVDTAPAGLDAVSERLEALGVTGLVIDDEADFHDFLEHNHQYWDYVDDALMQEKRGLSRVTFYLPDDADGEKLLSDARAALSALEQANPACAPIHVAVGKMADSDWENNWKQFYKPMEIGERLIVIPEWESANVPAGRAALVLGASRAFACDIDEKCVDVAYENAALNGVGRDRYTVRWGDVLTDRQLQGEFGGEYDIVVANIVADVIMGLSGRVRPFLKEGGLFLCSGIIDDRAEEVADKLRADGWTILKTRQSEGWFSYLCR